MLCSKFNYETNFPENWLRLLGFDFAGRRSLGEEAILPRPARPSLAVCGRIGRRPPLRNQKCLGCSRHLQRKIGTPTKAFVACITSSVLFPQSPDFAWGDVPVSKDQRELVQRAIDSRIHPPRQFSKIHESRVPLPNAERRGSQIPHQSFHQFPVGSTKSPRSDFNREFLAVDFCTCQLQMSCLSRIAPTLDKVETT